MRPLAAVERFFERLFERPTARLFHARLQPIQIQRRIERAMENERLTTSGRTFVPNRYAVHLNAEDMAAFDEVAATLAGDLADACLTYARSRRYTLSDRPQVSLIPDPVVAPGDLRVAVRFTGSGAAESEAGDAGASGEPEVGTPAGAGVAVADGPFVDPVRPERDHTMVFEVPQVTAPRARLRLYLSDGAQRQVVLDGRPWRVGRASDNDLVLRDGHVSRHHARIQARSGSLVLTDLDSTNGTRVNGTAIREVALGAGDRIELGDSLLVVESVPET